MRSQRITSGNLRLADKILRSAGAMDIKVSGEIVTWEEGPAALDPSLGAAVGATIEERLSHLEAIVKQLSGG